MLVTGGPSGHQVLVVKDPTDVEGDLVLCSYNGRSVAAVITSMDRNAISRNSLTVGTNQWYCGRFSPANVRLTVAKQRESSEL